MSFIAKVKEIINSAPKDSEAKFEMLRGKEIILYGAGYMGRTLQRSLQQRNLDITAFLDDSADITRLNSDTPLYSPATLKDANVVNENTCIIITFRILNKAKEQALHEKLAALGFKEILYYAPFCDGLYNPEIVEKSREKILEAAELFHDDESQAVFLGFLSCTMQQDFSAFPLPTPEEQYMPSLPFAKGLRNVIDCGAYTGDTALQYAHWSQGALEQIALFEPDISVYNRLCSTLHSGENSFRHYAFPCGLYDKNTSLYFNAVDGGGSSIGDTGETLVQCVRLDDALGGFAPTCIKMDIEGSEQPALHGARDMIHRHSPDLSICVYHKLEDIWEIPLLIKSINPAYTFYMRSHYMYGMESVVYAIAQ